MTEIAVRRSRSRARVRRWRPPNRRKILHGIYMAAILAWVARTGLLIAQGRDVTFQLILLPLWGCVYWFHHKLSRLTTDPHPVEWVGAGVYVLMITFVLLNPTL